MNFFETAEFNGIMRNSIHNVIAYLLKEKIDFGILVRIEEVSFSPKLPKYISENFHEITYFILAEYTLSSTILYKKSLQFEAGFGEESFESLVKIPLISIVQILVNDTPIFLNVAVDTALKIEKRKLRRVRKSKNIFLSNPENQDLFK